MADIGERNTAPDAGAPFGGAKAGHAGEAPCRLPEERADGAAPEASDENIVAAEFGGLDNDLLDMSQFDQQVSPAGGSHGATEGKDHPRKR